MRSTTYTIHMKISINQSIKITRFSTLTSFSLRSIKGKKKYRKRRITSKIKQKKRKKNFLFYLKCPLTFRVSIHVNGRKCLSINYVDFFFLSWRMHFQGIEQTQLTEIFQREKKRGIDLLVFVCIRGYWQGILVV